VLLPFRLRATISGVVNITIVLDVDQGARHVLAAL
jgi:hypothetical protein